MGEDPEEEGKKMMCRGERLHGGGGGGGEERVYMFMYNVLYVGREWGEKEGTRCVGKGERGKIVCVWGGGGEMGTSVW